MITTGTKLLVGATVLAIVSTLVYGLAAEGILGTIGLVTAAITLAFLAGVNIWARDSNVSAMDPSSTIASPAARPAPGPSIWPLAAGVGSVLVVVGLVTYPVVLIFGLVILLATAVEWMVQAWSERASAEADYNAAVRQRIAHPLEFPVLAAIGLIIIVYSFSRIMLFLSKTGGVAAFGTIAALLLLGGFLIAARPTARTGAVAAVAALATIGLVTGGIAAAIDGEREIHHHETTGTLSEESECATTEETEADDNASQGVAAKANLAGVVTLRDDGTLVAHMVGLEGEQDRLILSRSNPSNIRFRNDSDEDRRLVLDLGTKPELDEEGNPVEGSKIPDQRCTALVKQDGSQMLTVTIGAPSSSAKNGYRLFVPGVDSAEIEVEVL